MASARTLRSIYTLARAGTLISKMGGPRPPEHLGGKYTMIEQMKCWFSKSLRARLEGKTRSARVLLIGVFGAQSLCQRLRK